MSAGVPHPGQPGRGLPPGGVQDQAGTAWEYPWGAAGSDTAGVSGAAPLHPSVAVPAPAPRRDPQRTALAAVIAFVATVLGLWALLGYMDSLSRTLASINAGNARLEEQLTTANEGLVRLDSKTARVGDMAAGAGELRGLLEGVDADMGDMLASVDVIAGHMQSLDGQLVVLDEELGRVGGLNRQMEGELRAINSGLASQERAVGSMRRDVVGTSRALGRLEPRLQRVNGRLEHINDVTCWMGRNGISNDMRARFSVFGIPNGTATINAVMVPPGAWCR